MASESGEIEKLRREVHIYRDGLEAALRWMDRDYGDDARGEHSLFGQSYDDSYIADIMDIRRARRELEAAK